MWAGVGFGGARGRAWNSKGHVVEGGIWRGRQPGVQFGGAGGARVEFGGAGGQISRWTGRTWRGVWEGVEFGETGGYGWNLEGQVGRQAGGIRRAKQDVDYCDMCGFVGYGTHM
jgi:hypothetical protein